MTFVIVVAVILIFLGIVTLSAIANGWVLSILWGWFLVPLGAPDISIPVAIGIALVTGFLTHQYGRYSDVDGEHWQRLGEMIVYLFSKPLFALLAGLTVKQFL